MNNLTEEQRRLLVCTQEIGAIASMLPMILLSPGHENRTMGLGMVRQGMARLLERMDVILEAYAPAPIPVPSCDSTLRVTAPDSTATQESPT